MGKKKGIISQLLQHILAPKCVGCGKQSWNLKLDKNGLCSNCVEKILAAERKKAEAEEKARLKEELMKDRIERSGKTLYFYRKNKEYFDGEILAENNEYILLDAFYRDDSAIALLHSIEIIALKKYDDYIEKYFLQSDGAAFIFFTESLLVISPDKKTSSKPFSYGLANKKCQIFSDQICAYLSETDDCSAIVLKCVIFESQKMWTKIIEYDDDENDEDFSESMELRFENNVLIAHISDHLCFEYNLDDIKKELQTSKSSGKATKRAVRKDVGNTAENAVGNTAEKTTEIVVGSTANPKALEIWRNWSPDLLNDEYAKKRIKSAQSAKLTPIKIDYDDFCGYFQGSYGHYETFLDSCPCVDFKRSQRPCKHMFRLAMELGLMKIDYQSNVYAIPTPKSEMMPLDEMIDKVKVLSVDAQKKLLRIITETTIDNPVITVWKDTAYDELLHSGLVGQTSNNDLRVFDYGTKKELIANLNRLGLNYDPASKKNELESYCTANYPEEMAQCYSEKISICLSSKCGRRDLHHYLCHKHGF